MSVPSRRSIAHCVAADRRGRSSCATRPAARCWRSTTRFPEKAPAGEGGAPGRPGFDNGAPHAIGCGATTMIPLAVPLPLSFPGSWHLRPCADDADEVLRRAHEANLKLPEASLETEAADEKLREARAERWMKVAIDGDFVYAPPGGYDPVVTNAGEARLQLTAKQPILDGGAPPGGDRPRPDRIATPRTAHASAWRRRISRSKCAAASPNGWRPTATLLVAATASRAPEAIPHVAREPKGTGRASLPMCSRPKSASPPTKRDAIDAESRRAEAAVELDVLMGVSRYPRALAPSPFRPCPRRRRRMSRRAGPGSPAEPRSGPPRRIVRAARAGETPPSFRFGRHGLVGADTTNWSGDRWRRMRAIPWGCRCPGSCGTSARATRGSPGRSSKREARISRSPPADARGGAPAREGGDDGRGPGPPDRRSLPRRTPGTGRVPDAGAATGGRDLSR